MADITAPTKLPAREAEKIARALLDGYQNACVAYHAGKNAPEPRQWLLWSIVDKLQAAFTAGR